VVSDANVRSALQTFFASAGIPGLTKVYADYPWFIDGGTWSLDNQGGWGVLGYVHLDNASDERISIEWNGKRIRHHVVSLVLMYQFLIPLQIPAGQDESMWVAPLDSIIDAATTAIRQSPTLGNPNIFQAGQDLTDILTERELPTLDDGVISSWNRIEFHVDETIQ
jgi:hypothetical protein